MGEPRQPAGRHHPSRPQNMTPDNFWDSVGPEINRLTFYGTVSDEGQIEDTFDGGELPPPWIVDPRHLDQMPHAEQDHGMVRFKETWVQLDNESAYNLAGVGGHGAQTYHSRGKFHVVPDQLSEIVEVCNFQAHRDTYSLGYPKSEHSTHNNGKDHKRRRFIEARVACLENPNCKAITCDYYPISLLRPEQNNFRDRCTLRSSERLEPSSKREVTFTPDRLCSSKDAEIAPQGAGKQSGLKERWYDRFTQITYLLGMPEPTPESRGRG